MSPSWNTYRTSQWNSLHQASQWSVLKASLLLFFLNFNCKLLTLFLPHCIFFLHQSFTLEFHFEPNSYFSNTILTKTYKMKSEPDSADPFSFEGPEIVDCEGWETHTGWNIQRSNDVLLDFIVSWPCDMSLSWFLSRCKIDWQKGKDVTVKTIKKKQKHKGRGTVRTITKEVPQDSFFNFFNPVKGKIMLLACLFVCCSQSIQSVPVNIIQLL